MTGNRPKLFIDQNDTIFLVYCDAWRRGIFALEGKLVIAAATAETGWKDWRIIHTEKCPFFNEMLGDVYRWKREAVLSIMVQQSPSKPHEPTALRIIDFSMKASQGKQIKPE